MPKVACILATTVVSLLTRYSADTPPESTDQGELAYETAWNEAHPPGDTNAIGTLRAEEPVVTVPKIPVLDLT